MLKTTENKINEIYNKRIQKVKEQLNILGADAFITNNRLNFYYLSNFSGSTGILVITNDENYLIVDGRYTLRAKNEAINTLTFEISSNSSLLEKDSSDIKIDIVNPIPQTIDIAQIS